MKKKQRFLFISHDALISDIAWQVTQEGHEAKYYIGDKNVSDIADGFVTKTDDWKKEINWADVIIFDDAFFGMGTHARKLRQQGKKVIGGTPYTDRLEDERSFGQEELKKHGVNILSYQEFTDFKQAIEFVKQNPNEYVIKPSGEAQNLKDLLFIGRERDGADVIRVLEAYRRVWSHKIKVFQLQKKITGVEVAVGAFFNGNEFVYPININFEHKKLFPKDIGPSTPEMGTSMFWSGPNKLFNNTLKKMERRLAEEKYVGYIDLNCIVNGSGIYPLEFTSRFGYPTISIQQDSIITPISEFLYKLASGENPHFQVKKGFHIGTYLVAPPFPYHDQKTFDVYSKDAVVVFKGKNLDGIHMVDVKLVNGEWTLTGLTGIAVLVVGSGLTMKQAQDQAYNRIKNILIPNMYYRTDIGDRWDNDSDKLYSWGYLKEK
jgi:phosphoribosylamine--glycine ligase